MNLKPCAWSPALTRLGPDYTGQRVWADGEPSARDLAFWQSEGESVTLAYHEKDVKALEGELNDALEWAEKGLAEWRAVAQKAQAEARRAQAESRVAVAHLQAVLNKPRTAEEQQQADTAARDWLESIGSEP